MINSDSANILQGGILQCDNFVIQYYDVIFLLYMSLFITTYFYCTSCAE